MATPTVAKAAAGAGKINQPMILRETEWTLPKAAKATKVGATKGVAAKGVVAKGAAVTGATAKAATVQNMVQAKVGVIPPGMEWELPEAAKAGVTKGAVVKGATAKGVVKGTGVVVQGGATNGALATTAGQTNALTASTGVTTAAKSGTIWSGTGMKLGWGLGLGAWGPVVLVGVMTAVGVGIYGYLQKRAAGSELEEITS